MYKTTESSLQEEAIHAIIVLPEDKLPIIIEFANFLNSSSNNFPVENGSTNNLGEKRKKIYGTLKGKIQIADDFDETPDCFAEYL